MDSIALLDLDDRHVLAAAVLCGADVTVTLSLVDFPSQSLGQLSIEGQHPDDFVLALLEYFPDLLLKAVRNHRTSFKNPRKTPDGYLAKLDAQGWDKPRLHFVNF